MRDREGMIFACLARRAAHLARTCMFDMSSMAGGTTSTVSDGEREAGAGQHCIIDCCLVISGRTEDTPLSFYVLREFD